MIVLICAVGVVLQVGPMIAAGANDDLTKIRGVGPKCEQMLKSVGVRSYRQVAHLCTRDIEYLTSRLGIVGRIVRDDWMSGAAEEYARVKGKPLPR